MSQILKKEYEYIVIRRKEDKTKTSVFDVLSKHLDLIGQIRWWPSWRQYCFFPSRNTVFSIGCLDNINSFIVELHKERNEVLTVQKSDTSRPLPNLE